MEAAKALAATFWLMGPHLDERQRRLLLAAGAQTLGRGGITRMATTAGVARQTVHAGLKDLATPLRAQGQVRRPGGGRKRLRDTDPALATALDTLIDPCAEGGAAPVLRWTCKGTRELARALSEAGHPVGHDAIGRFLREQGYSLQANVRARNGPPPSDRDAQFSYVNGQALSFLSRGLPVVLVEARKWEAVGKRQVEDPTGDDDVRDLRRAAHVKTSQYRGGDGDRNRGGGSWIEVVQDHDTATLAVDNLRRWWRGEGVQRHPAAQDLFICIDAGAGSGSALNLWRHELDLMATEARLTLTACHLPPGTTRWNFKEHRLSVRLHTNRHDLPPVSHGVSVNQIATALPGNRGAHAGPSGGPSPTDVEAGSNDKAAGHLRPHPFHGDWNYTIRPA